MAEAGRPEPSFSLDDFYDAFPRIEEPFQAALDVSLQPSGPELLYDIVAGLQLAPGSAVVDVGCGEGAHSLELAGRFDFRVHGVDPVPRHIAIATQALAAVAGTRPELAERVRFSLGTAEAIPAGAASADLIWCRDVLVHVADLERAYAECRRVLAPGGHLLVYQMFATDRLEPREAGWLWSTMGVVPANANPARTEAAIAQAGLRIERRIELGSTWGEFAEERTGKGTRQLLHAARLLRGQDRYVAQFGQAAYDIMLGDCLWHVYRMIGKLSPRIYLLAK